MRRSKRRRIERLDAKNKQRVEKFAEKYRAHCPDCETPLVVGEQMAQCRFCRYHFCNNCIGGHRCTKPNELQQSTLEIAPHAQAPSEFATVATALTAPPKPTNSSGGASSAGDPS